MKQKDTNTVRYGSSCYLHVMVLVDLPFAPNHLPNLVTPTDYYFAFMRVGAQPPPLPVQERVLGLGSGVPYLCPTMALLLRPPSRRCLHVLSGHIHQTNLLRPQIVPAIRSLSTVSPSDQYDVVVVGGGMVGAALACALGASPMTSGLRVAVVDGQKIDPSAPLPARSELPDIRVSSVTPASVNLFKDVGAWSTVQAARHAPFDTMQVWDSAGQGFVRYSSHDVDASVLGYVVENRVLLAALHQRLRETASADLICPAKVDSIQWPEAERASTDAKPSDEAAQVGRRGASVHLSTGRILQARLVVGADGGRSRVRSLAGLRTVGWQYGQRGLVATVRTDHEHTTAWQRFLPTGPLALLPMGGSYSNIVWSTSEPHARSLESMPNAEFASAVNRALTQEHAPQPPSQSSSFLPQLSFLGTSLAGGFSLPPFVVEATGKRASFPLSLVHSGKYVQPRLALVGDAAHSVHPLAGQGVNLGFDDAEALAAVIAEGVAAGRDIGELGLLEEYEAERRAANLGMMAALDGLQRLFNAKSTPVALARNFGLDLVQWLTPVKKRIMSYAMGLERGHR